MRLIDADKVIENIVNDFNNIKKESNSDVAYEITKKATELFIKELNETPTAYDIDKVVEELEEIKAKYSKLSCSVNNTSMVREYIAKEQSIALAIEIVERGGKE